MHIQWGFDAQALQRGERVPVAWDSSLAVNGHALLVGMSGAGKTHNLRHMIREMLDTSDEPVRCHVFDVHGDIEITGASDVMFSEQTQYGMNPLRINPDPHFGGVRKRIQSFITTMNKVMRGMGPKQVACLRNVLIDIYAQYGFDPNDPDTWAVDESQSRLISDGSDGRLYIDVPIAEKDEAKALGAKWDGANYRCWYVRSEEYQGGITRWPPKLLARANPSIADALRMARYILKMSFLGTGVEAITNLEIANRAAAAYQRKLLEALRYGERAFSDEKLEADLARAKEKTIETFSDYANKIVTGRELDDLIKYDSTDVLKSVVDRLENLDAIGIFKPTPPPFDPYNPVWRYNIRALSMEERKLFVLFRLEEIFARAVQRGEQKGVTEVIVLDEAHIYADDDQDNIINTIAKEGRKFGLALICASQSPTHFTEDFISSVATKVILGIDEMYWRGSSTKMRVTEDALAQVNPQKTVLVQLKTRGEARNEWRLVSV